eukprot:SAG31_NODE_880_length_11279_cov_154.463238_5_plen_975_part_00
MESFGISAGLDGPGSLPLDSCIDANTVDSSNAGPKTWSGPDLVRLAGELSSISTPSSSVSSPSFARDDDGRTKSASACPPRRRLFTAPYNSSKESGAVQQPGDSFVAVDTGIALEPDSAEFRTRVCKLESRVQDMVELCEQFIGVARSFTDVNLRAAEAEKQFAACGMKKVGVNNAQQQSPATLPPPPTPQAENSEKVDGGSSAKAWAEDELRRSPILPLDHLGHVMGSLASLRDQMAHSVAEMMATDEDSSKASETSSSSAAERKKKSMWKTMTEKFDTVKKPPVIAALELSAVDVEKAKDEFEYSLAQRLAYSADPAAVESSTVAAESRLKQQQYDLARLDHIRQLEHHEAQKQSDLLEGVAQIFFAKKQMLARMQRVMDEAEPSFTMMRHLASKIREQDLANDQQREEMSKQITVNSFSTPETTMAAIDFTQTSSVGHTSTGKGCDATDIALTAPEQAHQGSVSSYTGFLFAQDSTLVARSTSRSRSKSTWMRVWAECSNVDGILKYRPTDRATELSLPRNTSNASVVLNTGSAATVADNDDARLEIPLSRCQINEGKIDIKRKGQAYTVLKKATIRKEQSMTSDLVGSLQSGQSIVSMKTVINEDGRKRIKFSKGWVSEMSKNGDLLLAPAGRPYRFSLTLPARPTSNCADASPSLAGSTSEPPATSGLGTSLSSWAGVSSSTSSGGSAPGTAVNGSAPTDSVPATRTWHFQAEMEDEYRQWLYVLHRCVAIADQQAKERLAANITEWLDTIPIGGKEARKYDPTELIAFGWANGLETEPPERIYKEYVETASEEGMREAERLHDEFMKRREAPPLKKGGCLPDVRLNRAASCPAAAVPTAVARRLKAHHIRLSEDVAPDVGEGGTKLGLYRVKSRATLRVRFDPRSARMPMYLEPGQLVRVIRACIIADGRVRVQVKPGTVSLLKSGEPGRWSAGWTSLMSKDGVALLSYAADDPEAENAGAWIDSETV